MGLRIKILSGFLILSMMLLLAGAWSIYQMKHLGLTAQKILDENYKSVNAAKTMLEALERADSGILLLLLGSWEEGRSILDEAARSFRESYAAAEQNITIPGEESVLAAIKKNFEAYETLWKRPIVGTSRQGNIDWYTGEMHAAFLDAKTIVNRLLDVNGQEMYKTASLVKDRANRAVMPGIVAMISAVVFSLILTYLVNVFMVGPLIRITEAIDAFIERGKAFEIEVSTKDEIARLSSAIKRLSDRAGRAGAYS